MAGSAAAVSGIVSVWAGPQYAGEFLMAMLSPLVIGAVAGMTFRSKKSVQFFLLVTSVTLSLAFTANYYFLKFFWNTDLITESRQRITEMIQGSGIAEAEKREFMSRIQESLDMVRDIVPFTYFLNALVGALICFFILRYFFSRYLNGDSATIEGIELFKLNDYFIFILIFGWLVVLLVDRQSYYPLYVAGLNSALSFSVLYLLQAMGIAKFFMNKKGIPPYILPVSLLILLFFGMEIVLFISIILLSIGALDFWADFRKLEPQSKKQV